MAEGEAKKNARAVLQNTARAWELGYGQRTGGDVVALITFGDGIGGVGHGIEVIFSRRPLQRAPEG